ncbi:MAG: rhomboid family intramembrane serine protease [Polyangiaceae bacterium]
MLPLRDHLPTRRPPWVVYALIVLNVLAFLWSRALMARGVDPSRFILGWGAVPARILADPAANAITLLTSTFLHDPTGFLHIGGNMLFLWIFGDNVEDAVGSARFIAFYLLCGLIAAIAQVAIDPHSHIPIIGASGAISGVLAAYASLYPRAPITVLNPIPLLWLLWGLFLRLPAWLVILEYFAVNLFNGLTSVGQTGGGVAFFAHIGGFIAGLFLIRLFMIGRATKGYDRWQHLVPPKHARGPRGRGDWG